MSQFSYYTMIFVMSFVLLLIYLYNWRKQFHVSITSVFIIVPILELIYLLMYAYHDTASTNALMKVNFMCVTFLPVMTTFCEMNLCMVHPSPALRTLMIGITILVMIPFMLLDIIRPGSILMEEVGSVWVIQRDYGPLIWLYRLMLSVLLIYDIALLIRTFLYKKQVSKNILLLLVLPLVVSVSTFLAGYSSFSPGYEVLPLTYVVSQWFYLWVVDRMAYHNVSDIVIESMVEAGDVGFITVDFKGHYLGSNETARRILPALENVAVDHLIQKDEVMKKTVLSWIEHYQKHPEDKTLLYTTEDSVNDNTLHELITDSDHEKTGETHPEEERPQEKQASPSTRYYAIHVGALYYGGKQSGYQIFMEDDTQKQKYIKLLDHYNLDLQKEVANKTERIVSMHEQLIMGMATMVESRDNSTGGHIRRTSEGVRLLTEAIQKDGSLHLSESFCNLLIKAAPMHDLGKIAVDDAILRKPGRYTPEEFEVMKSHAAEGARIVHEILKDTDDEDFRRIAENVAHYHHERMDGSGYPNGLKGEEIPMEARIMAIADVYDALVSKRVYKDSFSFEKADQIVMEGMGTQFDPQLEKYYEEAKPKLEAYYLSMDAKEEIISDPSDHSESSDPSEPSGHSETAEHSEA